MGMYTVAKGPTALLQKTRRGLSRGLESPSEGPPEKKEQTGKEAIIFHPVKMRNNQRRRVQHEHLTEDHQELITFVTERWIRETALWPFIRTRRIQPSTIFSHST